MSKCAYGGTAKATRTHVRKPTASGAVKAEYARKEGQERPDVPDRSFRRGQIVRFFPPEAAYHPDTAQAAVSGQIGQVAVAWSDSYCTVKFFERQQKPLLVNSSYLVLEERL